MHLVIQIRPFTLVVGRILLEYIRDIRKIVKLGLLALSFGKTQVEKNGGTSKYRTQGQTLEHSKTQVETVRP
jgi:hypothetical protein